MGGALLAVALSTLPASASGQDSAKTVTANLSDGRQFQGQIDAQSNRDRLVLRSTRGSLTLWRSLKWTQLVRLESDGAALDAAVLRGRIANSNPGNHRPLATLQLRTLGASLPPAPDVPAAPLPASLPRVTSVTFDAALANWDADVETDGIWVDVAPLDADGVLAAVAATVDVELFVPQRRTLDLAPLSGGDTLEILERWSRAIEPADFGPSGARLKLPFGAVQPELRPDWVASHYGLVHLRLSAPGHGVFEASRDGVRIQPWAPNRDRLEMQTGSRFLPTENLGRQP